MQDFRVLLIITTPLLSSTFYMVSIIFLFVIKNKIADAHMRKTALYVFSTILIPS